MQARVFRKPFRFRNSSPLRLSLFFWAEVCEPDCCQHGASHYKLTPRFHPHPPAERGFPNHDF